VVMVRNAVRSLLAEPRASDPPRRVWRDWVLVAGLLTAVVLEGVLRDDVLWRPVAIAVAVATVCALLWRRTHPLGVVTAVFGALIVVNVVTLISGDATFGLNSMICVVLLPYSLVRWGSGREILVGLAFIMVALVLGIASDFTGYGEAAAGSMFLLFPATLGAAFRYRWTARTRELGQVRLRERELLARELHDTVAHHVSAIVIRAQAGRAVAATRPDAAVDALAIIEAEGTRTLAEMRAMVGVLRDDGTAALAPQPGVADLERLARSVGDRPRVEVEVSGDLDDLGPAVGAAIYRIAQESITNAVRHARQATRIDVRLTSYDDSVRLTVRDNGEATSRNPGGYGLVGMTERATLLGGTLAAGPDPDRGWSVDVVLPLQRSASGR
jgi:signal transduction histidine kinase